MHSTISAIQKIPVTGATADIGSPTDTPATTPGIFCVEIKTLLCPSDQNIKRDRNCIPGRSSYGGNFGDFYFYGDNDENRRAVFQPGQFATVTFANIEDGSSNTLLFSERRINTPRGSSATGGSLMTDLGGLTNTSGISANGTTVPGDCLTKRSGTQITGALAYSGNEHRFIGYLFTPCRATHSGFHAILPPNSISCARTDQPDDKSFVTASSYHPGGVNATMADASVRFVSEGIDCGNLFVPTVTIPNKPGLNYSGPSPWGIWGAMGSINGAESVALPQ